MIYGWVCRCGLAQERASCRDEATYAAIPRGSCVFHGLRSAEYQSTQVPRSRYIVPAVSPSPRLNVFLPPVISPSPSISHLPACFSTTYSVHDDKTYTWISWIVPRHFKCDFVENLQRYSTATAPPRKTDRATRPGPFYPQRRRRRLMGGD